MNMKKVAVLPFAVIAMGLTSCNNGLSRHSFKDSTKDAVLKIFESLPTKQIKDDKITMQNEKVTLDAYTEYSGALYLEGLNFNLNDKIEYKGNLDKNNKTAKISVKQEGFNLMDGGISDVPTYTKMNLDQYIKFTDKEGMILVADNSTGFKAKMDTLPVTDFNTFVVNSMPNVVKMYGDIFVLLNAVENKDSINFNVDLTGYNLYYTFIQTEVTDRFSNAKATVKYGSNDENSAMISIKGSLGFEDYTKCWSSPKENETATYSGTVDFDYYACLEDCFLTQSEIRVKYNDCKLFLDSKQQLGLNASAYSRSNVNYKAGAEVTVDETQFADILK